jgi:uncharacterized protein
MASSAGSHSKIFRLAVVLEGGLGLAAIIIGRLFGRPVWAEIDWNFSAVALGSVASLPLLGSLVIIVRNRAGWCVRLRQVVDETIMPLFKHCSIAELATISLLAGFGEELLFRGLLQGWLGDWFSPSVGLLAASLLFGLAHPLTLGYAIVAGLAGLYLGGLWLWSDNLLVPIVTHAAYDFLALAYLVRRHRAKLPPLMGSV